MVRRIEMATLLGGVSPPTLDGGRQYSDVTVTMMMAGPLSADRRLPAQ